MTLPPHFFTRTLPTPVRAPKMILFNDSLAHALGLSALASKPGQPTSPHNTLEPLATHASPSPTTNATHESPADPHATTVNHAEWLEWCSGNRVPEWADPIAQAYAGHQFAHFTMLGDGRAILLGEHVTPALELTTDKLPTSVLPASALPAGARFDVQLKGAGRTPYSRRGDGRAALGPMLREYIISEAMHALGIPTTRSLAVVSTGEKVYREEILDGAVLTRIASSHIRVGTFQFAAAVDRDDGLRKLTEYTIQRHDADLANSENRFEAFLHAVIDRQARLIAQWNQVGFIHGVMNTDNMSIAGETIDYGPCAFMDRYDPETVFSSIDRHGRYAFGNQPQIAQWNLARFAETLLPLLDPATANNTASADPSLLAIEKAKAAIDRFPTLYMDHWLSGMRHKLGLSNAEPGDLDLVHRLLNLMQKNKSDYTATWRALGSAQPSDQALFQDEAFHAWRSDWQNRLSRQPLSPEEARALMNQHNPAVIPRNHLVEAAIQAATAHQDFGPTHSLIAAIQQPFLETEQNLLYRLPPETEDPNYRTFCGT